MIIRTLAAFIFAVLVVGGTAAQVTDTKLSVSKIDAVEEVEPAIFEIAMTLEDGSKAQLRMNALTMEALNQALSALSQAPR